MQSSTFDSIMSSTRWAAVLTAAGLAEKRVHAANHVVRVHAQNPHVVRPVMDPAERHPVGDLRIPPLVPVPGDIGA